MHITHYYQCWSKLTLLKVCLAKRPLNCFKTHWKMSLKSTWWSILWVSVDLLPKRVFCICFSIISHKFLTFLHICHHFSWISIRIWVKHIIKTSEIMRKCWKTRKIDRKRHLGFWWLQNGCPYSTTKDFLGHLFPYRIEMRYNEIKSKPFHCLCKHLTLT